MSIERLAELRQATRIGVMTHLIAGYPSFDANRQMLERMIQAEVDVLEVQFPFSDPIADGPLFLKANQGALDGGTGHEQIFEFLAEVRQRFSGPLLMMGYANTVLTMGEEIFLERCQRAGLSGFILPDLPPEYSGPFREAARKHDLAPVLLVAPNTPAERMAELAPHACGMVYAVARKGVTGRKTALDVDLEEYLSRCRAQFPVLLGVGFGLATAEDIRFLRGKADLAIVGSALLQRYLDGGDEAVAQLLEELNSGRS